MEIKLYGAEWCGTCRMVHKILEDNDIDFEFVDCDECPEEADRLDITELPVVILWDEDEEVDRWDSTMGDITRWLGIR